MKARKAGRWFFEHERKIIVLLGVLGAIYILSMFLVPWFRGGFSHVHDVWMDWQGLNVGVLAFTSSYIIFLAATYHEEAKRERSLSASRAMLPHALSEITHYLMSCMGFLRWLATERLTESSGKANDFNIELPDFYREVFRDCIESADQATGEYLSGIINRLQIHNSRLRTISKNPPIEIQESVELKKIKSHMCDVAEIYAMVANLYPYARGQGNYDNEWLTKDEIVCAFRAMSVSPDSWGGLMKDIDRMVERRGMMYK